MNTNVSKDRESVFTGKYEPTSSVLDEWGRVFEERLNRIAKDVPDEVIVDLAEAFARARDLAWEAWLAEEEAERERDYLAQFADGAWANVYEISREYGGPEEGGWWYDVGQPVRSIKADTYEIAKLMVDYLANEYPATGRSESVLGGEDYRVTIEPHEAKAYPEERPHYE